MLPSSQAMRVDRPLESHVVGYHPTRLLTAYLPLPSLGERNALFTLTHRADSQDGKDKDCEETLQAARPGHGDFCEREMRCK